MENNAKKSQEEKTVIMSGQSKADAEQSVDQTDKTQVISNIDKVSSEEKTEVSSSVPKGDKTVISTGEATTKSDRNNSSPTPPPPPLSAQDLKAKGGDQKKGFTSGELAAGMAGAAVAGGALGVAYGEEIKEAYAELSADKADGTESPSNDITESSVSYTDTDGTTYSVSLTDFDGDGRADVTTANIIFADGSNVQVVQTGDLLSPLFSNGTEYALPSDYALYADFASHFDEPVGVNTYHIVPGDTLSEIALEHGTTVEEIMELNPQIEDADLIYAGDDIILPGADDGLHLPLDETPSALLTSEDQAGLNDIASTADTQDFDQVEWASFDGDLASADDGYDELLANTDFETYEAPDSYLMDMGTEDFL